MKRAEFGKEQDDISESLTDQHPSMPAQPSNQTPGLEFIAEHTVGPDETLSHLALKYYGSAARELWMPIYEANKEAIGPNPNVVRPGTVVKIPKKPSA